MTQPTLTEKDRIVIAAYAQGNFQREIEKRTGYSLGKVNQTIAKARKIIPDLENLRKFYLALKKKELGPPDIERTISFLTKLDNLGLTLDQLSKTNNFLEKTGYGEKTNQYIALALELQNLEKISEMTGQQFLEWYRNTSPKKDAIEKEVEELFIQKEQLKTELPNLIKLNNMKNTLLSNGITLQKLQSFLDTQKTLEKLGYTKEAANIFATELNKTGMTPETAAHKIAEILIEAQSLENKKNILATENDTLQQKKTSLTKEIFDSTNKLNEIKKRFQTIKDDGKINIEKEVQQIWDETEEKLKVIQTDLKNKENNNRELDNTILEKTKELRSLEESKEELKDHYFLGEGLIQLLRDPESATLEQLRRLYESAKKAIEFREEGLHNTSSQETHKTKDTLTEILTKYVRKDMVPKYEYDNLQKNVNEDKRLKEKWENKYLEISKILIDKDKEIENLKKLNETNQNKTSNQKKYVLKRVGTAEPNEP